MSTRRTRLLRLVISFVAVAILMAAFYTVSASAAIRTYTATELYGDSFKVGTYSFNTEYNEEIENYQFVIKGEDGCQYHYGNDESYISPYVIIAGKKLYVTQYETIKGIPFFRFICFDLSGDEPKENYIYSESNPKNGLEEVRLFAKYGSKIWFSSSFESGSKACYVTTDGSKLVKTEGTFLYGHVEGKYAYSHYAGAEGGDHNIINLSTANVRTQKRCGYLRPASDGKLRYSTESSTGKTITIYKSDMSGANVVKLASISKKSSEWANIGYINKTYVYYNVQTMDSSRYYKYNISTKTKTKISMSKYESIVGPYMGA